MQQIVSILKVCGPESEEVLADLVRRASEPDCDLKGFLAELKARIGPPSYLSYWEYYDSWSMGDSFEGLAMPEALPPIESGSTVVYPYRLAAGSGPWLKDQLQRRDFQIEERRWLYETVLKALEAFNTVVDSGVLLVFREVIGASFDDSEISGHDHAT